MKFSKLLFLISYFLVVCLANGKSQEISFNHLTTDDGLSNNSVRCLYQDEKGFIWIGTRNGVNLYNGDEFIIYKSCKNTFNYKNVYSI